MSMSDWLASDRHWLWLLLIGVSAAFVARVVIRLRSRVPRAKSRRIAGEIIADRLKALRRLSYADLLRRRTETSCDTVIGLDGWEYQVETQVFWDEPKKKGGNLRVMVSVDGGGVSAFKPLLGAFVIAPDGSFIEGSAWR
jgi:hypothetical protein